MPKKYTYQLVGGKTLTLEGDDEPTDAEVESAAQENGVRLVGSEDNEQDASTPLSTPEMFGGGDASVEAANADAPPEPFLSPGVLTGAGMATVAAGATAPATTRFVGRRLVKTKLPGYIGRGLGTVAGGAAGGSLGTFAGPTGAITGAVTGATVGGGIGASMGRNIAKPIHRLGKTLEAIGAPKVGRAPTGMFMSRPAGTATVQLGRKVLGGLAKGAPLVGGTMLAYDLASQVMNDREGTTANINKSMAETYGDDPRDVSILTPPPSPGMGTQRNAVTPEMERMLQGLDPMERELVLRQMATQGGR